MLEVSFGTGPLLTEGAGEYLDWGHSRNDRYVQMNFQTSGLQVALVRGGTPHLPYPVVHFDCLVNTTSYSGYREGKKGMFAFHKV